MNIPEPKIVRIAANNVEVTPYKEVELSDGTKEFRLDIEEIKPYGQPVIDDERAHIAQKREKVLAFDEAAELAELAKEDDLLDKIQSVMTTGELP